MTLEEIEREALALPLNERALLAQRLLFGLEEISESEFDRLWSKESAARAARFDGGQGQTIPAMEAARKARALLLSTDTSEQPPRVLGLGRGKLQVPEGPSFLHPENSPSLFEDGDSSAVNPI